MLPAETPKSETSEAEALLRAAARDLKTIEILMRAAESPLASVCFHVQQYLEKIMKAALVSNSVVFRRTHDLAELADLLEQQGMTLPAPKDQLTRLNPFAVVFRYDDIEITTIDLRDVEGILQVAQVWQSEQTHDTNEASDALHQ